MEKSNMTAKTNSPPSRLISALILAAGKGTRMKSTTPKVLHPVMGQSMLEWVMDVVKRAGATDVTVVLSPETKAFEHLLAQHKDLRVAIQSTQRGTGDAVAAAAKAYSGIVPPTWSTSQLSRGESSDAKWVLICAGDTPGMNPQTIRDFISTSLNVGHKLSVLGMNVKDPKGYGRLVTSQDQFVSQIVEERDATAEQRKIKLCNTGIIFTDVQWLFKLLKDLTLNNAQSEYYLTDIFTVSAKLGEPAFVFQTDAQDEFAGINDRMQLEQLERAMITRKMKEFMANGVTFHLPETTYLENQVIIEPDTRVYSGVCLVGRTHVSRNCIIGPGAYIENSVLGAGVKVGPHAVLVDCQISAGESISPQAVYSNLRT